MINELDLSGQVVAHSAPSIGSIELSYDPVGNRVRQIATAVISTDRQFQQLLYTGYGYNLAKDGTRTSIRALVNHEYLAHAASQVATTHFIPEAMIRLSGSFETTPLVYFGANSRNRITNNYVRRNEQELVGAVTSLPRKDLNQVLRQTAKRGFALERLTAVINDSDYADLKEMYERSFTSYPFDIKQAIIGMVEDESSVVFAARSLADKRLHAVCAAEQVDVPLFDGRTFRMWEMGDSARLESGRGLNAPLKIAIIKQASRSNVDLLFCESRAALRAVNQINHSIGMEYAGMLIKHTVISGPEDISESRIDGANAQFGNMNVWALNRAEIASIALKTGSV